MLKKPLFWETCFLALIVGVLNYIATIFHLYWSTSEFDSVVHFFGGAFLASFFLWLYFFSGFFAPTERTLKKFIIIAFFASIFVAVSWEIYELILGEAELHKSEYPYDTTLDFIMDILGILVMTFYGYIKELQIKKL